ncbi:MAG: hypothetical protein HOC20_14280 [Chloroflexi bacterium]|jgi:hypothetical protein|nr:hypothetical protein [Chloroflexota bacterium]
MILSIRSTFSFIAMAGILLAGLSCSKGDEAIKNFEPGELSVLTLQRAAVAAGFQLERVEAEIPSARRPGVEFNTLPWDDSLLVELRIRYDLEAVVEDASDEWQAQLLLNHWIHNQIENGTPEVEASSAIEILDAAADGKKFWCSYYAITYAQCALALGWQARKISLDHFHDVGGAGSRHHGAAEVWSNKWRKWIYIDPQSDLHFEREGVPLSSWEVRQQWLDNGGANVDHVTGVAPDTTHKNPSIVWWDLEEEDETALFFWLIYHDNYATWEEDSPSPFYTPRDSFTDGKTWYQGGDSLYAHTGYRLNLFKPVEDIAKLHWTVGVVEAAITGVGRGKIIMAIDTWQPDFLQFQVSFNGDDWEEVENPEALEWNLGMGLNGISIRAVNKAGVSGPRTTIVLN